MPAIGGAAQGGVAHVFGAPRWAGAAVHSASGPVVSEPQPALSSLHPRVGFAQPASIVGARQHVAVQPAAAAAPVAADAAASVGAAPRVLPSSSGGTAAVFTTPRPAAPVAAANPAAAAAAAAAVLSSQSTLAPRLRALPAPPSTAGLDYLGLGSDASEASYPSSPAAREAKQHFAAAAMALTSLYKGQCVAYSHGVRHACAVLRHAALAARHEQMQMYRCAVAAQSSGAGGAGAAAAAGSLAATASGPSPPLPSDTIAIAELLRVLDRLEPAPAQLSAATTPDVPTGAPVFGRKTQRDETSPPMPRRPAQPGGETCGTADKGNAESADEDDDNDESYAAGR